MYWFVYKTHFWHTVALMPENVAVRGLTGKIWVLYALLCVCFFSNDTICL